MNNRTFVIDFDSTLITIEALDQLAEISLRGDSQKEAVLQQIKGITQLGMEGKLSFDESLSKRLALFQTSKNHLQQLTKHLLKNISPSIARNKSFFKKNCNNIYIISGGFSEYIIPVAEKLGISASHVLANEFTFNKKGIVTGFNQRNPLSKKAGKVKAVKTLNIKGEVIVIGDGYTDYEIRKHGVATRFYCFTENVRRDSVANLADKEVASFDEILFDLHAERSQSFPKSKMKVLLLENIDPVAIDTFEKQGYQVKALKKALSEHELSEEIKEVSILGIRSKTEVTASVLHTAKRLMAIGAFCIGTNQIDLASATKKGVAVFNAPYSNTRSVVELAIGEIIMLYRSTFDKSTKLHTGVWDKSAGGNQEIRGKKLGIIGYGNIGTQLGVLAESLGMQVYFYDVLEKLALGNARRCKTLKELLKVSDVVTVHVDGRKDNTDLIGAKEFSYMKNGVIFLNSSRGHVVDINALARFVTSGKIRGSAIDVYPHEPKSNDDPFVSPLQGLSNVILTPHVGGSTEEAQKNIGEFVSARLSDYIDEGSTVLSVNMPTLEAIRKNTVHRFIHIHQNKPGVLAKINAILAEHTINIEAQNLATSDQIGYVITDVNKKYNTNVIEALNRIPETITFRVLY